MPPSNVYGEKNSLLKYICSYKVYIFTIIYILKLQLKRCMAVEYTCKYVFTTLENSILQQSSSETWKLS